MSWLLTVIDFVSRFVYVWDTTSRRILYKLPGHAGSVNEVAFHPEEPVGELNNCFGLRLHPVIHVRRIELRLRLEEQVRDFFPQRYWREDAFHVHVFFCQHKFSFFICWI